MKQALIDRIIDMEWEMFQNVNNEGGKAICQERPETFRIMRSSQALTWSRAMLESYIVDLLQAKKDGRNLMTEKYARMMAYTAPSEYEEMKHLLPAVTNAAKELIDRIVQIHLAWQAETARKYPYVALQGRPTYSNEDTPFATSIETYMRGELSTYSEETLRHYLDNAMDQIALNINGAEEILFHTVRQYGFSSLQQADDYAKNKS